MIFQNLVSRLMRDSSLIRYSLLFVALLFFSCSSNICEDKFDARPLSKSEAVENGYEFRAVGNEPSWQLLIIKDRIEFYTPQEVVTHRIFCMIDQVGGRDEIKYSFFGNSNLMNIEIHILNEKCNDSMSGENFNRKVEVIIDKLNYRGCGEFLK